MIAGDIEGGTLLKRIGAFLTDYIFFEDQDNDLVVDTDSMYGGVAREKGRYLFDQGSDVSHFRYFATPHAQAMQGWLTEEKPAEFRDFEPIAARPAPRAVRGERGPQPVVMVLPGIMGSHLRLGAKDRIWFDFLDIAAGGIGEDRLREAGHRAGRACSACSTTTSATTSNQSHEVRPFPYDWRRPLADEATRLAAAVELALNGSDLPVRLSSHSMGGLSAAHDDPAAPSGLGRAHAASGLRWVMLGTPNSGSHSMVETLLGPTIRCASWRDWT